MALSTYELSLAGFRFPNRLPGKHSNFRFVADVRYVSSRGEHDTQHAIMPDLERHWECDPDRTEESQYVRGADIGSFGTFDMSRIDAWDRLILLVRADAIHSVQVKVFDIDRPNFFDRLGDALGDVIGTILRRGRSASPGSTGVFADALGTASADVESALLVRLAGGDRLLFRGSVSLEGPGDYLITGSGDAGEYEIGLELEVAD